MRALKAGALAAGLATELWTPPLVSSLVEWRTGRRYTESHVWRILMSHDFRCQRPGGRALERNESAVKRGSRNARR